MLSNKWYLKNQGLVIVGCYILVSIIVLFFSKDNGTMSHWLLTTVLGPTWHLSAFASSVQRPFEYLDGITRFTSEDILYIFISLIIWFGGVLLLRWYTKSATATRKRLLGIGVIILWIAVAILNMFFHALYSV